MEINKIQTKPNKEQETSSNIIKTELENKTHFKNKINYKINNKKVP